MCHHNLFLRAGLHEENRMASIGHARASIQHGQDDALALTFAGFSIGMDGHDHAAAFATFEAALAVSPLSALTYVLGSVIHGWTGEAEHAIEWGERAMRLSPFDPWAFASFHSLTLGTFTAAATSRRRLPPIRLSNLIRLTASPICCWRLRLQKLGRLEEAKAAAARVLQLQPAFR